MDWSDRVLKQLAEDLSAAAKKRLEKLGVEIRLGQGVDQIDEDGVVVAGERIASKTVIWTAGVAPSPAGRWLNVETDRAGRVRIQPDLSVPVSGIPAHGPFSRCVASSISFSEAPARSFCSTATALGHGKQVVWRTIHSQEFF
jgi:pyruvate/2-oxoglutarate dehydrogenase complex dihydrolipoamide dehydrogenase (E3) component